MTEVKRMRHFSGCTWLGIRWLHRFLWQGKSNQLPFMKKESHLLFWVVWHPSWLWHAFEVSHKSENEQGGAEDLQEVLVHSIFNRVVHQISNYAVHIHHISNDCGIVYLFIIDDVNINWIIRWGTSMVMDNDLLSVSTQSKLAIVYLCQLGCLGMCVRSKLCWVGRIEPCLPLYL